MSNIFEEVQRGHIVGGNLYVKKEKKKDTVIHKAHESLEGMQVTPYYEGGMHLETYGESKFRGLRRTVARKAPIVTRNIISVGKRTITPAIKSASKAVFKAGMKIGKSQFEDLKRRKQKGMNVFW